MPIFNTEVTETINITENGQYDVARYTSANVSVSGGGGNNTVQYTVTDGVLGRPNTFIDLTGVTDIADEVCMSMYFLSEISGAIDMSGLQQLTGNQCCFSMFAESGITSIDLSGVTTISGESACVNMCGFCLALESFDLSSLEEVSDNGANSMFFGDEALTSANLPALTTIGSNACEQMFSDCPNITSVNMSNVETIGSFGCSGMFGNDTGLTSITFDSLTTLESGAFNGAFGATSLTSLSFPALTTFSDGSEDAFSYMLQDVDGCTVHFPAALQSTMENWQDVQDGFGGTNTTILFDL